MNLSHEGDDTQRGCGRHDNVLKSQSHVNNWAKGYNFFSLFKPQTWYHPTTTPSQKLTDFKTKKLEMLLLRPFNTEGGFLPRMISELIYFITNFYLAKWPHFFPEEELYFWVWHHPSSLCGTGRVSGPNQDNKLQYSFQPWQRKRLPDPLLPFIPFTIKALDRKYSQASIPYFHDVFFCHAIGPRGLRLCYKYEYFSDLLFPLTTLVPEHFNHNCNIIIYLLGKLILLKMFVFLQWG